LHPNPNHKRSLELLEVALKHTPTLPELHMAKALVLKRAGDVDAAAVAMEEARLLDGQDRFLNGKAAKYWLRSGDTAKAEELLALFTKKDMTAVADLTEMQCLWFLQEEGDAHKRNGALALALKRYQSLVTVFQEYEDDQYDFHTYCMRRMTFNTYIALIKYEDQLRSHPAYFKSALSAIDIYVAVSDDPSITEEKLSKLRDTVHQADNSPRGGGRAEEGGEEGAKGRAEGTKGCSELGRQEGRGTPAGRGPARRGAYQDRDADRRRAQALGPAREAARRARRDLAGGLRSPRPQGPVPPRPP
jgi:peptide alpha-N-acetyltransferase